MGFSTWPFGPNESDMAETYSFLSQNADIYSEQIDYKIPWNTLINNTAFPDEFITNIDYKISKRITENKLLLSVSLLNTDRNDLLEDYDGNIPSYTAMNDQIIEDAYVKYLEYLIGKFNPDYLVFAMEVNELRINKPDKWEQYKLLAANIHSRIKAEYPDLPIAESFTLHNYFNPDVSDPDAYISEITDYINQNNDFAAISFYPYFKGFHTKEDFQLAFDFLNSHVTIPIAFVETSDLAETLKIRSYKLKIESDVCEQKDYLETLMLNAYNNDYEFIIWWAYRDYDELWKTLPSKTKDLAKLWRDTGLLDEDGVERPAFELWKSLLDK